MYSHYSKCFVHIKLFNSQKQPKDVNKNIILILQTKKLRPEIFKYLAKLP